MQADIILLGLISKYGPRAGAREWLKVFPSLRGTMDGNEIDWITVKGNHIPIKPGQSKEQAVKEFMEEKTADKTKKPLKEFLGREYTGVKGQAAVEKLLQEKQGHVKGAFTRKDIGDIDLVWGDEYQGLAHLIKSRTEKNPYKAEEILNHLTEVIEKGVLRRGKSGNFEIWHNGIMAIVRPDYYGKDIRFILTGYKQRSPNKN